MCLVGLVGKLSSKIKLSQENLEIKEYNSKEELMNDLNNNYIQGIVVENKTPSNYIVIEDKGNIINVDINTINKIYKLERVSVIETTSGNHIVYTSLNQIETIFADGVMLRINQSEIYPKRRIRKLENAQVVLDTGEIRKLGRRYAKDVRNCLKSTKRIKNWKCIKNEE